MKDTHSFTWKEVTRDRDFRTEYMGYTGEVWESVEGQYWYWSIKSGDFYMKSRVRSREKALERAEENIIKCLRADL